MDECQTESNGRTFYCLFIFLKQSTFFTFNFPIDQNCVKCLAIFFGYTPLLRSKGNDRCIEWYMIWKSRKGWKTNWKKYVLDVCMLLGLWVMGNIWFKNFLAEKYNKWDDVEKVKDFKMSKSRKHNGWNKGHERWDLKKLGSQKK